ncbi:anti-lipopolysaccharide factor-like [Macrobrachium nipponense]|uniref:anti-lipopolysaccharide factor-like n=1 Tax=Macrobrachium nipponense TaxID=159736 RepID=UPI0030C86E70|nr:anti-lipopolysaccharide factor 1 [Macrobrachium nipponense]
MRAPSSCVCALLGLFLMANVLGAAEGQELGLGDLLGGGLTGDGLVQALTSQLVGLWETGDLEFLDHVCSFQVKPKIKRWELYFRGTMWCPGWTPIRGTSETRSRSSVVNRAVADFVQKALTSGLVTEEEARNWLNHQ